jgi:hypothetical protein
LGHNKTNCTYSELDLQPQLSEKSSELSDAPLSPPSQSDDLSEEDEYLQGLIEEARIAYIADEVEGPQAIARLLESRGLVRSRLDVASQTIKEKCIAAAAAIMRDKEVAEDAEQARREEEDAFWAQEMPVRLVRPPQAQDAATATIIAPVKARRSRAATVTVISPRRSKRTKR